MQETRDHGVRGLVGNGLAAVHARIARAFGAVRHVSERGGIWTGCWGTASARTAGNSPRPSAKGVRKACSGSSTPPTGMRRRCATSCGRTSSSTWATSAAGCWSSTRPASSRRGPSRRGWRASTAAPRGDAENQQIGVFLLYASDRGAAFIDRALYLPDEWMGDAARRTEAHIPARRGLRDQGRAGA